MRKRLLIGVWLLIPIVLLAVHYGPGQRGIARDRAAEQLALAQAAEKAEAWTDAMQHYADALAALPSTDARQRYQIRLAAAKARMYACWAESRFCFCAARPSGVSRRRASRSLRV